MKKALVCKICDEISWVEIDRLNNRDRKYNTCAICYEFIEDESNVQLPLQRQSPEQQSIVEDF